MPNRADALDETRMTIGQHLEELRTRLLRSLIAVLIGCLACIWPARYLLELLARPVILALRKHHQPDSFLATSPTETLLIYVKVVVIAGLTIAAPYVLHQLWAFVAAGLYRNERQWVTRLVPWSLGLFVVGVLFMYTFALPVSLNFLIGFNTWLPLPQAQPTALDRMLLRLPAASMPASQPAAGDSPVIPVFAEDPADPPAGHIWVNLTDSKLKFRGSDATYSLQLLRDDQRALATTHFRIGEYLTFVLIMTIAFGAAFQLPLVVIFLVRSGIVPAATLRRYRKVVILVIVIIAGILAPPDLFSHLLLSGPMILLFEIGLYLGSRSAARQSKTEAPA